MAFGKKQRARDELEDDLYIHEYDPIPTGPGSRNVAIIESIDTLVYQWPAELSQDFTEFVLKHGASKMAEARAATKKILDMNPDDWNREAEQLAARLGALASGGETDQAEHRAGTLRPPLVSGQELPEKTLPSA